MGDAPTYVMKRAAHSRWSRWMAVVAAGFDISETENVSAVCAAEHGTDRLPSRWSRNAAARRS